MKRKWEEPTVDILDVGETMAGTVYNSFDGDFVSDQEIPTNENGLPLIGKS